MFNLKNQGSRGFNLEHLISILKVRIEDNIYINEYGAELLTEVPRTVEEIEKFMSENNIHLK